MQSVCNNKQTIYNIMKSNGYWVMSTGKDDLNKKTGICIDGSYKTNGLGFSDISRTKGKCYLFQEYPKPSAPYGVYLKTILINNSLYSNMKNIKTEFDIYGACSNKYKGKYNICGCLDKLHYSCSKPILFNNEMLYHDNWVTQQTLNLLNN